MRVCVILSLLIIVARARVVGAQTPEHANDRAEEARTHLRVGLELYGQGRYDDAIYEFRAGQAANPQPEFLYALGQSERKRGNCRAALDHYRAFVKEAHELEQVGAATKVMAACEKQVADEDARLAEEARQRIAVQLQQPAQPPRPWWRDPAGGALVGVGAASFATGAVLFGIGQARYAVALRDYDHYVDAHNVRAEFISGVTLLAVGGAALVGGAVRWGYLKRHHP